MFNKMKYKKLFKLGLSSLSVISIPAIIIACQSASNTEKSTPVADNPNTDNNSSSNNSNPNSLPGDTVDNSNIDGNIDLKDDDLANDLLSGSTGKTKPKYRPPEVPENKNAAAGYKILTPAYETFIDDNKEPSGLNPNNDPRPFQYGKAPNEQYEYINDHTVKLAIYMGKRYKREVFTGRMMTEEPMVDYNLHGTGWFMDYLVPDNPNEYPTTWFIATNLHNIPHWRFEENGGYTDVVLPLDKNYKKPAEYKFEIGYSDFKENGKPELEWKGYTEIEPKLVFSAVNFLGDSIDMSNSVPSYNSEEYKKFGDYFKDFAVLEVKFKDQEEARKITRNIAQKYKDNWLSFRKESLMSENGNWLYTYNQFYVLGYGLENNLTLTIPVFNKYGGIEGESFNRGDFDYSVGSKMSARTKWQLKNKYNQYIPGITDAFKVPDPRGELLVKFNDYDFNSKDTSHVKYLRRFGVVYSLDNDDLAIGASGSMGLEGKTKDQFKVFGIQFGKETTTKTGFLDPLIFEGFSLDGKIIYPKYDLIYGVEGQKYSYAQSMKKNLSGKTSKLLGKL
ncbi:DUF31 family protein [Mycoplasma iguanae]|uniref:DUF31 family protein n=1 Tax=Mycoplasma iguanae TaxID=292461 RepID=A0ABY5R812_9MOLU|nr:DUF31 family protein [Mycoplasma iguanae]UVD81651.1 DUF31 family protein [Mycoplasma iguanae]